MDVRLIVILYGCKVNYIGCKVNYIVLYGCKVNYYISKGLNIIVISDSKRVVYSLIRPVLN